MKGISIVLNVILSVILVVFILCSNGSRISHSFSNIEEETYAVIDYPLIDIPIRYNESEVAIVIANNMMRSDEYLFSNNKRTLENMQTKFHVITFPIDRGTTPDSKVFIYEDNILIKAIPFCGEYSNDEKFDLDSLPKEDIEEKIGQKLPPLF